MIRIRNHIVDSDSFPVLTHLDSQLPATLFLLAVPAIFVFPFSLNSLAVHLDSI